MRPGTAHRRSYRRINGLSALTWALVVFFVVVACSIPVGGEASPLDPDENAAVVYGSGTTTTTEPPEETAINLRLFFIDGNNKLESVIRPLDEPTIGEVLDALQDGPTNEEQTEFEPSGGLRNALPAGLDPQNQPRPEGSSVLAINVSDEAGLRAIGNEDPEQAEFIYSQIVCTLTGLNLRSGDSITGVEFYDSQGQIQIVDANRTPIEGPARASDFNECLTASAEAEAGEESTSTTEA
jgi:hypothetical protein